MSSTATLPTKFSAELLSALNIDASRCRKAVITLEVNQAVIVECEIFGEAPKGQALPLLKSKWVASLKDISAEPVEAIVENGEQDITALPDACMVKRSIG